MGVEAENPSRFTVRSIRYLVVKALFSGLGINFKWNGWVPLKVNIFLRGG
ncbi:hypothetical protein HanOQP8_Chr16g0597711 [Helianthus annuus]|nr:hypothetical protein HanHA89_Chr16g0640491 [Helianthus annuus]KAJ0643174.1 hypothetical protein HanOQP8_Chr16g0597711 [Helianthus annuus]